MSRKAKSGEEKEGQLYVWQGYHGKVELISFKTFLTRPVRRVALGAEHSLILTHTDEVYTCGSNEHGQLGCSGTSGDYSFDPCLVETVSGQGIKEVACGTNHSACVRKDGQIYMWGDNHAGQCGLKPSEHTTVSSPTLVALTSPGHTCEHGVTSPGKRETCIQIAAGAQHTLALSAEGNVWSWGKGPQLGLGNDHAESWEPVIVKKFCDKSVLSITCGQTHNIVLVQEHLETKVAKQSSRLELLELQGDSENVVITACEWCKSQSQLNASPLVPLDTSAINISVVDDSAASARDKTCQSENGISISAKQFTDNINVNSNTTEDGSIPRVEILSDSILDKTDEKQDHITEETREKPISDQKANGGDETKGEHSEPNNQQNSKEETVELRKKSSDNPTDRNSPFTSSIQSDTSMTSSMSSKVSRSISFLDETGAREFLARQFQEDEDIEPLDKPLRQLSKEGPLSTSEATPSSPSQYMIQTMTSLTSQVSSMTSKALSNIAAVPGKFRFSTSGPVEDETKSSTETLEVSEVSDLEMGSTENINLDNAVLEFSNLTAGGASKNSSQLSITESETSFSSFASTEGSPSRGSSTQGSPVKSKKSRSDKGLSMESQSIRTIEAKQENLRKRSLSLLTAEEEAGTDVSQPVYSLDTEVWCWGRNSKGQLGLGDMIDRDVPVCIQIMTGRRIIKVACGSLHTVAISSTGEVYSWGLNDSGQLGHNNMSSSPARIELTSDCNVWDIDAGSNHSIFLMDNSRTVETSPDVFYTGKHPCKDLYVPIFKTPRLSHLKFLKKACYISCVVTGGDNCACIGNPDSRVTLTLYQLTRVARDFHVRMYNINQDLVKRVQISGYFKSLDTQPYKDMLSALLATFSDLSCQLGVASVELSSALCRGDNLHHCSLFSHYEVYVSLLKAYSGALEDMVSAGGFEFVTKNASSLFDTLGKEVFPTLLQNYKADDKPDHAATLRNIMVTPIDSVKTLSQCVGKLADLYDKSSRENNMLSSVYLNLEHFIRTSKLVITDADNTKKFWDTASSKISESLRSPSRRLIKESKSSPLSLANAGRFSTHTFYLFNDIFIHSQYSSYQSYPLETVWIDTPASESSGQQYTITVTTPEDVLSLNASSAQVKVEWVVAFNTAINKVLANQKSVSRQSSGERVHTPVIRLASHTFTKHPLYKDAAYKGYWLNGKVHGSGFIRWQDNRRYKGKFKHGSITGSGKMVVAKEGKTEEVQEGQWKDAKLHGHGRIRYSTGDLYEGFFKDGLRHGHGVYRKGRYLNSASFVYVGEWLYDKKHGYGVLDDILKGEKYMGMWQEDSRHGDGIVVTLDGMYFEGNFQYNKLVGHGLMLTDDNSCYEGEFAGITLLQGKGTLTFANGDKIEGTFNGTWNQGLKLSGTFIKSALTASTSKHNWSRVSLETKTSLYGRLCVRPDRKWEEIFYQCYEALGHFGDGEPSTSKAWDQIVTAIVAGKQRLKDTEKSSRTSKQKLELCTLEQLEKIPAHNVARLTVEQGEVIIQYLTKACETTSHPLGELIDDLVDVFRAAYIGIGAHPRLLHHAVQEIQSYMRRIYKVIRVLFPELPTDGKPTQVFPEKSQKSSTKISDDTGFIQRQISETDEEDLHVETLSAIGLLQPLLMPRIYPALFDLYALHCDKDDEKYWERVQKLNKQGDMSLMAYLGIDESFWCLDQSLLTDKKTRISNIKDHCYSKAVEVLQHISTAFCPRDKLEVIQRTFLTITQTVQEHLSEEHLWCMDDLFPIFQFVVIRARIHHLGAEISFIEELMESYLEFGELGIMFTTLKACYFQIQTEKMPTH